MSRGRSPRGGKTSGSRRWLLPVAVACVAMLGLSGSTNYTMGCQWLTLDGGVAVTGDMTVIDLLTATGLEGGVHASANYTVDPLWCQQAQVTTPVSGDVWRLYR